MRWWLCSLASLAAISHHARVVRGAPELAFPVNSQVPPVAFTSQSYFFTFSASTFRSDKPEISYSLGDAPAWLSLDAKGRTLRGTPGAADVGAASFVLNAQDEDGQTPSSVTLIVLHEPNLHAGQSILPALQNVGSVSAPATLLLKPLEVFEIRLSAYAFTGTSSSTTYYAVSSDNSPLPPWVQFDSTTLSFSGSSPPLVSPTASQQTYGIHLIATEVKGFAEAVVSFQIAVSYHILAFAAPVESLAVQPDHNFASPSFRSSLMLDGEPIGDSNIASVTADLPAWASLDSRAISIRGRPPADFQSQAISVHARDISNDIAIITFTLINSVSSNEDISQSINLTAVAGQYFSYTLDSIYLTSTDNISADLGNASDWLSFSIHNFTLQGFIPSTLTNQSLDLSIAAEDSATNFTSQIKIWIQPAGKRQPVMSTNPAHSASNPPTKATTNPNDLTQLPAGTHTTTRTMIMIVLSTVLPSLAILALIVICLCYRRRRRKRNGIEAQKELSARASFQTEAIPDTGDLPPVIEESRISNDRPRQITPVHVPQIDLFWAPDSLHRAKNGLSKRLKMKNRSIDSSWGEVLVPPMSQETPQPLQEAVLEVPEMAVLPSEVLARPPPIPSYSAKRQVQNGKRLSKQKYGKSERVSKVLSVISNHSAGLPSRLSGAGHGSGALMPETMAGMANRSSWQTTLASIPQGDPRPSTPTLATFPRPPTNNKENEGLEVNVGAMKPSMRLVDHSSEPSESFEIQRQRWHRDRARNRLEVAARFSNASSSRTPSLSLPRLPTSKRSPSRTVSPAIPENATIDSRSQPSWSKWSGIGPAARTVSGLGIRAPAPLFAQQSSRPAREVSMASSGQFDSALSSDSQWEDENLIAEVNDAGERHWLSDADSTAQSPRLPFDPFSSSQEEVGQADQVGVSRGARLIDKRKHVSVEEENLRRSEKSQAGSFRFI